MNEYRGGLRWGGGSFGQTNVSYPFAKLSIGRGEIILSTLNEEFTLTPTEVTSISQKNRILYKGIVFHHTNSALPRILVFWTFESKKILSDLDSYFLG